MPSPKSLYPQAFTKELVNAERCALFLVNNTKGELYSNMFDEGHEKNGKPIFRKSDEIRYFYN